jgi:hypothetical protein
MAKPDRDDYRKYVAKRIRDLMRGRTLSLPGVRLEDEELAPIYGPIAEAVNRAYAQGWIDSEIDFVQTLGILSAMADDPTTTAELWDVAQKRPKTDDAFVYRRDWIEYEYARDQLSRVGIDLDGRRPSVPNQLAPKGAKQRTKGKRR